MTAPPTVLADQGACARPSVSRIPSGEGTHGPLFGAPGLLLVAALAIFEGYHWLHLFPGDSFRTASLLFVLGVAPATFALTRRLHTALWPRTRHVACMSASVVAVLGLVVTFDRSTVLSLVVGLTCLVLAASLVSLVVVSERRRPAPGRTD